MRRFASAVHRRSVLLRTLWGVPLELQLLLATAVFLVAVLAGSVLLRWGGFIAT